jgi:hypothetical protein
VTNENKNSTENGQSIFDRLYFLERFYLKNRGKIFLITGILILGAISIFVYSFLEEQKKTSVNEAYFDYQQGINKEKNLKFIAESNPKLHDLILFSELLNKIEDANNSEIIKQLDIFSKSGDWLISDISEYSKASLTASTQDLNNYSYKEISLLKDFAILTESYSLIKEDKIQEAHDRMAFIEADSKLKNIADYLMHYGISSNKN